MTTTQDEIEAALGRSDYATAMELAIRTTGARMLRFFSGALGARGTDIADAYSSYQLQLWIALPAFRARSKFETFAFTIARRVLCAAYKARARGNRHGAELPTTEWSRIAAEVMTSTMRANPPALSKLADVVRAKLDYEDRELLYLRATEELSWAEIAKILVEPPYDERKEVDRLKKAFSRILIRVREMPEARELAAVADRFRVHKAAMKRGAP